MRTVAGHKGANASMAAKMRGETIARDPRSYRPTLAIDATMTRRGESQKLGFNSQ